MTNKQFTLEERDCYDYEVRQGRRRTASGSVGQSLFLCSGFRGPGNDLLHE